MENGQVEARRRVLELTTLLLDELDGEGVTHLAGDRLKAHLRALSARIESELASRSRVGHLRLIETPGD